MAEDAFNSFNVQLPKVPNPTQFPYPTYEDHEAAVSWMRPSLSLCHILWLLDGPLEFATSVLSLHDYDGVVVRQEPLCDPETGKWHPIADSPITEPRVSSVKVSIHELDNWEDTWCERHWDHSEPHLPDTDLDHHDRGEVLWSITEEYRRKFLDGSEGATGSGSDGGDDENDSDDDEIEDGAVLLRCCGEDRPRDKKASIVVTASDTGPDAGYVTIRDYVSALQPWMTGLRGEILRSMGRSNPGLGAPLGASADLTVSCLFVHQISIIDGRDMWFNMGPLWKSSLLTPGKRLSQYMSIT